MHATLTDADAVGSDAGRFERIAVAPSRLEGHVRLSGAKNSALRLLAASVLTPDVVQITNAPTRLLDVDVHVGMLRRLGKRVTVDGSSLTIEEPDGLADRLDWRGRSIRNTILILGAGVARNGTASVPLPGGCRIGERKYDIHIDLLTAMGASVSDEGDRLSAAVGGRLRGVDFVSPLRSTGVTENAILMGSLANGTTRLVNPHISPEVRQLAAFVNGLGGRVTIVGHERIEIEGVDALHGSSCHVIPDRLEAITWLVASVITGGDVEIWDFPTRTLAVPLEHLRESGAKFFEGPDSLIVRGGRPGPLSIVTGSHPAIHSDMQPMLAVFAALAPGLSEVIDLRYPDRFAYVDELRKLGLSAEVASGHLTIHGGKPLRGTTVTATDLRAGAALLLAGLVAAGETVIEHAWQLQRGYDAVIEKVKALGGRVMVE